MNLLDRFSTHLRDVLARSIHLAGELKNTEVEPIHLLFTLSNQKGAIAAELLGRFKLNPKTLEQAIINLPLIKEVAGGQKDALAGVLTPLSQATKMTLEKAMQIAQENQHNFIGTEHLLSALLSIDNAIIKDVLVAGGIAIDELNKQVETVLGNASQFPNISEVADVVDKIQDNMEGMMGGPIGEVMESKKRGGRRKESALDFFGANLTSAEAQKNIDPVIGRDVEIERVIQILSRRTKNNPLLLGDPGVGKTAIVEGLAKRIMEGKVPDILLNKKIYALDMGMLIAGTMYRGEFEGRLRQVIDEVTGNSNIIIFIDEIHNIVGAGSNQGTMDAANILKPALSRGQIRCIGATTPAEYKKYIENDAALERRFQPVFTKEPSLDDTIKILLGIKVNYEAYHNVEITDEAVETAAKLADRYITSKFLPDKAIDLLDETAAAKRIGAKTSGLTSKVWRLEQKLEKIIQKKEEAAGNDKFMEAVEFKKEEEKLRTEIKAAEESRKTKKIKLAGIVTAQDVGAQVAKIIGTPTSDILVNEQEELNALEKKMQEHIVGQTDAIKEIGILVRQARLGLSHPDRPLASFMFVGESGVGKTETAKTLAEVLYKNKSALIKLDMSEFNESFGVSKLLGSPAGYIGYKESNQFTDKVKMNPYSVVLFDEIDKAHKDVLKLLLQILENGEITESSGKKISLRHAIIIMTTSFGSSETKRGTIGFGKTDAPQHKSRLIEKLKEFFSPEIINRIDSVCWFEPLTAENLVQIAELELNRFNERLKHYHTSVHSSEKVMEWIVNQLPEKNAGARDIRKFVRKEVEQLMTAVILNKKVKNEYGLTIVNEKLSVI